MAITFPMNIRPFFPGKKANVEYHSVDRTGATNLQVTIEATIHPLTTNEVTKSNGVYLKGDKRFVFAGEDLRSTTLSPKLKDYLIYESSKFVVVDMSQGEIFDQHKVVTRNLKIAYQLKDIIHFYRPRVGQDLIDEEGRTGTIVTAYDSLALNVACRLQTLDKGIDDYGSGKRLEKMFSVPCEEIPDDLEITDQVRVPDGRILEIKGINDEDTIDFLPTLMLEDMGARWDG